MVSTAEVKWNKRQLGDSISKIYVCRVQRNSMVFVVNSRDVKLVEFFLDYSHFWEEKDWRQMGY